MNKRYLLSAFTMAAAMCATAQITMNIDATRRGPAISNYQYGLFFEEINHAGDGGLYAELVRNRSFEEGLSGWTAVNGAQLGLLTSGLMNTAQGQALDLNTAGATAANLKGAANEGFWGMSIVKDSVYTLALWAKAIKPIPGKSLHN